MRTTKEIFANGQALTLAAAKALVGKTISVTNVEYEANSPSVRTGKVLDIKSTWDIAGEEDYTEIDPKYTTRQEYWESYMNKKQIEASKKTLILIGDSELNAACYAWNINSVEPYFHGSDADRPIYYIVEDEN